MPRRSDTENYFIPVLANKSEMIHCVFTGKRQNISVREMMGGKMLVCGLDFT